MSSATSPTSPSPVTDGPGTADYSLTDSPVYHYNYEKQDLMLDGVIPSSRNNSNASGDNGTGDSFLRSPRRESGRVGRRVSSQGRMSSYTQSPMQDRLSFGGGASVSAGPSTAHLSKAAAAAHQERMAMDAKFLERDVAGNKLIESHYYRGFYYLMRHTEHSLGSSLREELFPQLTLALEAVLHDLVLEQLQKEVKAKKAQQTLLGNTFSSFASDGGHHHHGGPGGGAGGGGGPGGSRRLSGWRQHPTYPTGQIRNPAVHPILMLAKELKKRGKNAKVSARESGFSATTSTTSQQRTPVVGSEFKRAESDGGSHHDEDDDHGPPLSGGLRRDTLEGRPLDPVEVESDGEGLEPSSPHSQTMAGGSTY